MGGREGDGGRQGERRRGWAGRPAPLRSVGRGWREGATGAAGAAEGLPREKPWREPRVHRVCACVCSVFFFFFSYNSPLPETFTLQSENCELSALHIRFFKKLYWPAQEKVIYKFLEFSTLKSGPQGRFFPYFR